MSDRFSNVFNNAIGGKQGYLISPILFGLCIHESKQMIAKFVTKGGAKQVVVRNVVIMLLLYLDRVVPLA